MKDRKTEITRALTRTTLLMLGLLLSGCAILQQDGADTQPRTFNIPIRNAAYQIPPYTLVEGNPIPDYAWLRERASECESWELGQNGCGGPPASTTAIKTTTTSTHVQTRHYTPRQAKEKAGVSSDAS
jgi:hypothetical protein